MPIASTDLLYKFSYPNGGTATAGDAQTNTTAGTSLGKNMASSQVTDNTLDNLFPDMTGDENAASNVDYQCIFIHNNHASLTLQNAVAWLSSTGNAASNKAIGLDPAGIVAHNSSAGQAAYIANKNTAPSGVTFSAPTSKGTGLSIGNIGPGQVIAIWVRRTATNSAATNSDGCTLRVEGDTAA